MKNLWIVLPIAAVALLFQNCERKSPFSEHASSVDGTLDTLSVPLFEEDPNVTPDDHAGRYPAVVIPTADGVAWFSLLSGTYEWDGNDGSKVNCPAPKTEDILQAVLPEAGLCVNRDPGPVSDCGLVALGGGYLTLYQVGAIQSEYPQNISLGSGDYEAKWPDYGCHPTIDFCNPERAAFMKDLLAHFAALKGSCPIQ